MLKRQSNPMLRHVVNFSLILLGNAMVAFAVCYFILPMNFIMGGVTGLSLILDHYFSLDITVVTYAVNAVFFLLGFAVMGKRFALGIVISTVAYPTFLHFFRSFDSLSFTGSDVMLAMIFAALMIGVGDGLILRAGASSGGLEVLSVVMNKKFGVPLALMLNIVDISLLIIQLFYSSIEQILYGILLTFVLTFILDKVVLLGEKKTQVMVISEDYEKIRNEILKDLDLGCTMLEAQSGFVHENIEVVMCVLPNYRLTELHNRILSIDPGAFIVTTQVNNVKGRGFSLPKQWGSSAQNTLE